MKLLFDQNLSHQLVRRLVDLFPESAHVREANLAAKDDLTVWNHARAGGYVIVSKDDDFHHLSFAHGAPPKVIGIQLGNCTTNAIEQLIRERPLPSARTQPQPTCRSSDDLRGAGSRQDALDSLNGPHCMLRSQRVFPNAHHAPTMRAQQAILQPIPRHVALDLRAPEGGVVLRPGGVLGAAVKEAAVDKDGEALQRKHEIGTDRDGFGFSRRDRKGRRESSPGLFVTTDI